MDKLWRSREFACDADYEPQYFFWEMIVFARKLLVLIVSIWLPNVSSMMTRTLALSLIVFVSVVFCEHSAARAIDNAIAGTQRQV